MFEFECCFWSVPTISKRYGPCLNLNAAFGLFQQLVRGMVHVVLEFYNISTHFRSWSRAI